MTLYLTLDCCYCSLPPRLRLPCWIGIPVVRAIVVVFVVVVVVVVCVCNSFAVCIYNKRYIARVSHVRHRRQ
jgi:hypothetical protein